MKVENIKFDCKHFKGHIPCLPNKAKDCSCADCDEYAPVSKKILIIKLGAIGDVIRTTPLITRYKELFPDCHITWLTLTPDILPTGSIDVIYNFDHISIYKVLSEEFDIAINLDKDKEACMLLADVKATEKFGFTWKNNHIDVATANANHKLITGLFDHISKVNTKSYLEEIFEICHMDYNCEEYLINYNKEMAGIWKEKFHNLSKGKKIIGLNTGCGERWKTRLWPKEYWIELMNTLRDQNYFCVLLGGKDEDKDNSYYSEQTGTYYPGYFSLEEFIALTSNCDIVVTPVSMMMHIAMAHKKQLVLFNNIFNKYEFELFNRGVIIEPESGCDCFYGNHCKREKNCMYDISVSTVVEEINKLSEKLR